MKRFVLILLVILLFISVIFAGLFLFLRNKNLVSNNKSKVTSVTFVGAQIPLGFYENPVFGKPSFTGILSKYTVVSNTWIILQFQDREEVFGFNPTKTFVTNYSNPKATKTLWSVPTLDQLKTWLSGSIAVTLKFDNLSLEEDINELPNKAKESTFSMVIYTYPAK